MNDNVDVMRFLLMADCRSGTGKHVGHMLHAVTDSVGQRLHGDQSTLENGFYYQDHHFHESLLHHIHLPIRLRENGRSFVV